jgi:hypothetical protein
VLEWLLILAEFGVWNSGRKKAEVERKKAGQKDSFGLGIALQAQVSIQ